MISTFGLFCKARHMVKNGSVLTALVMGLLVSSATTYAQGTWVPVANAAPHYNEGEMMLLSDGTVIAKTSSGPDALGNVWDKLTPDANGSYINGTWSSLPPMFNTRLYFSSQVLMDGRVYVAGGEYGTGGYAGEVYDPIANTWTMCPALSGGEFISDANSEILPDGKILQAIVGSGSRRMYIYNPVANTYTTGTPSFGSHNESAWVKLPDNSILFVDIYSTNSERYIPATNTWVHDANVPVLLYDAYGYETGGAFLLPDGRAFFIGAAGTTAIYTPSGSTAPGSWVTGPAIPGGQGAPDAAAAMMVNGKIIFTVSPPPIPADHFPTPMSFYEYDYVANTITPITTPTGGTSLPSPCYYSNMLCLPNGHIMYVSMGDDQYYEYVPDGTPLLSGQPTISNITELTCTTFRITGTLFNGITEGANYGDDWQMNTNYPIIRLSSGPNVYYARSYNWNSTGVMRGSAPDTTYFTLPLGLPNGTYAVEVVANGNPSAPVLLTTGPANLSPLSSTICEGGTTTLIASIPGGIWTSSTPGVASVGSVSGLVTANIPGTTTIDYSLGTCASVPVSVGVNPLPIAAITPAGPTTFCSGSNVTLNATTGGGYSYQWQLGGTNIPGATAATYTATLGGSYTVVTSLAGCSAISTAEIITVLSSPTPSVTAAGPTTFCTGGSVALSTATGGGFTYQWASGGIDIVGETNSTFTATSAGTYTIRVTDGACVGSSAITTVGVTAPPVAAITAGGPTTFCTGSSVMLNATTGTGYTYQWQSGGTPISGATNASYTATLAGSYTVITSIGGCGATSSSETITTIAGPAVSVTPSGPTSFCTGGSVTLSAVSGTGLTYQWQLGGVNISGATNTTFTTTTTGSYTVLASSGGCPGISTPVAVTVNPSPIVVPSVSISATPGTVLCLVSAPVTLTATAVNGGSLPVYQWSVNGVPAGVGSSYTYSPATGDVVSCQLTSSHACAFPLSASAATTMTISPLQTPAVSISVAPADTICRGTPATFMAVPVYGGTLPSYTWTKNGTTIASGASFMYSPNNGDMIICTMTSNYPCITSSLAGSTPLIEHVKNPSVNTISVTVSESLVTSGSIVTFTAVAPFAGTAPVYQWYLNSTPVPGANSAVYVTDSLRDGQVVKCAVTSSGDCVAPKTAISSGVKMTVAPTGVKTIGNANNFTLLPNPNKGEFTISGILTNTIENKVNIRVTNVIGQAVFTKSVTAANGRVDEQVKLGNNLASGTYLVTVTSGEDHIVFHIVVNR